MSNIKISEMAEAESLNDNDLLTIVQSGINKKITKQNAIGDIIQAINNPTYTTTEGTDLSIDNTRVGKMKFKYYGNTSQNGTPTPNNPVEVKTVTGENNINITSGNFLDGITWTNDKYINSSNEIADANSWRYSDYVDISEGNFFYQNGVTGNLPKTILYDANKNPIQVLPVNFTLYNLSIYNAKYIRISTTTGVTPQLYQSQSYEINLGKNLTTRLTKQISYNLNGLYAWWEGNTIGVAGTNTKTDANWTVLSDYVPIMPNFKAGEIYTLSAPDMPTDTILAINYSPTGSSGQASLCICDGATKKITFTVPSNYGSMGQIFFVIKSTVTTIKTKFNYMLEKGSQATNYVPYLTPIELCKIGDLQDYIYTNGSKWFKHKEIGKVVFDGSETDWNAYLQNNNVYAYYKNISDSKQNYTNLYNVYNYFSWYAGTNALSNGEASIGGATSSKNGNFLFCVGDTTNKLTDFKIWLSTHNVSVYYALATPIEEEITETTLINQLNAIKYGAESYYGQTNIIITSEELQPTLKVQTLDKIGD